MSGATCAIFMMTLYFPPTNTNACSAAKFRSARIRPVLTRSPTKLAKKKRSGCPGAGGHRKTTGAVRIAACTPDQDWPIFADLGEIESVQF